MKTPRMKNPPDPPPKNRTKEKPPKFPEPRTIKHTGFTFLGFKPTKGKHMFYIVTYSISLLLTFCGMIVNKDWYGLCANWFFTNMVVLLTIYLTKLIISVIKTWNDPLE